MAANTPRMALALKPGAGGEGGAQDASDRARA